MRAVPALFVILVLCQAATSTFGATQESSHGRKTKHRHRTAHEVDASSQQGDSGSSTQQQQPLYTQTADNSGGDGKTEHSSGSGTQQPQHQPHQAAEYTGGKSERPSQGGDASALPIGSGWTDTGVPQDSAVTRNSSPQQRRTAKSEQSVGSVSPYTRQNNILDNSHIPKDQYVWDGEASWEWENKRTLYFEVVAGLGNRLRALASAVVLAKEFGVGLKVIWREESGCGDSCGNPGFNSTWPDLFAEPKLRLADNFPGSNYEIIEEQWLMAEDRNPDLPPLKDTECPLYVPKDHADFKRIMQIGWTWLNGEEVLCMRSDQWLTEAGEKEGKFFFRLLKPSPMVQSMIDRFKWETEWEENHMVGVHVRRGDLTIYGKDNKQSKVKGLIPISSYLDAMQKQKALAAGVKRVRFFLATDDAEAEKEIKAAFKPGYVMTYPKHSFDRKSVLGIQEALVDVMLLADSPVLIGTYYSSYSETAKMMGWPFYIQVGHALKALSVETKFDKEDPDEEDRRRKRVLLAYDAGNL